MSITYKRHAVLDGSLPSTATVNFPITINAGDTVVIIVDEAFQTVVSVADSGGAVYSQLASEVGAVRQTEIWGTLSADASTSINITFSGTFLVFNVDILCFTGVNAFGHSGVNSNTGSTTPSVSLALQDVNGYMVAGFGNNGTNPGALSSPAGTFVTQAYASQQASLYLTSMYNTSASPGSLTCSYVSATSVDWQSAAIELRPSGGAAACTPKIGLLGVSGKCGAGIGLIGLGEGWLRRRKNWIKYCEKDKR